MDKTLSEDDSDGFGRMGKETIRCITINTHRGRGPKIPYLLAQSSLDEAERIELLHSTRAYTYFIAEWLNQRKGDYDVVGLQEVFNGVLGFGDRIFRRFRQRDHYRVISGFRSAVAHGVGFAGFRYENLLLSHLQILTRTQINHFLPGKIAFLATGGFTLAPFVFNHRIIWIGNTHLHPYQPKIRATQARSLISHLKKQGDVPVIFMGDYNTVPPGCKNTDFPAGERDVNSYKNDDTFKILQDGGLILPPHQDHELYYTYPTGLPNRTLDYILYSSHWEILNYRVVNEFKFSDHYPVSAEFRLKPMPSSCSDLERR
ncbi:MAG: endonuclease/exonuclease/phosphatase family protein [Candidatus Delongbacteria bacterium]|nr:endonuclease/exonuclease/phosphatase family protein [Candidatus Delongbacteria bacterium]